MHLPQGIAALLAKVSLCSEEQANSNSCPPSSQVGEATAIAGLGPEPFIQRGGKVFITGPYQGAPFGLQILTPAVAGPFNLGYVSVRSKLVIDPNTAAVSIETPSLPTQLKGIPLELKRVLGQRQPPRIPVQPHQLQLHADQGTTSKEIRAPPMKPKSTSRSQNCNNLPFKPTLTASTHGHASKANGTDFLVTVTSGGVNAKE